RCPTQQCRMKQLPRKAAIGRTPDHVTRMNIEDHEEWYTGWYTNGIRNGIRTKGTVYHKEYRKRNQKGGRRKTGRNINKDNYTHVSSLSLLALNSIHST
ncbi:hypothetical protein T310_5660, partial [Rasamsonia emersonii CBS 393.64]